MSESEVPPEEGRPSEFQVEVPPELQAGVYANFLGVWHSAYEFTLDFGTTLPAQPGDSEDEQSPMVVPCQVTARIKIPVALIFNAGSPGAGASARSAKFTIPRLESQVNSRRRGTTFAGSALSNFPQVCLKPTSRELTSTAVSPDAPPPHMRTRASASVAAARQSSML